MDLGIRGRKAIVCASSKGLGRACAEALGAAGVDLVINARNAAELEKVAEAIRRRQQGEGHRGRRRHHDTGRPPGRARRLPQPRYPGEQCRRPAARRFPPMGPRSMDGGHRRQHADAHRADEGDGGWHDGAGIRAHRQHHVLRGEGAHRFAGPFQRRALRASPVSSPAWRARRCARTSPSTICCPDPLPPTGWRASSAIRPRRRRSRATRRPPNSRPKFPPAASASRRNSVRPAPSSAPSMPATSPGRTGCWMAAIIRGRSDRRRSGESPPPHPSIASRLDPSTRRPFDVRARELE